MTLAQIDIIPSYKIDKGKWDNCINSSNSNLIYAQSFYLDALADNWHGIVANDYDCVMPIPWRKKLGIRYCYDAAFIQQSGYYTLNNEINTSILFEAFFKFIKYGHYNFNFTNNAVANIPGVRSASNYIIDLVTKEEVTNNFTKGFKQSLNNSLKHDLSYTIASPGEAIESYKKHFEKNLNHISNDDYKKFAALTEILIQKNNCVVRKIINNDQQTLSIVLLLKDNRRLYNIINATNEEGRKKESNYFLYAQVFDEFAGSELLFDLEGSELPGVKSFYKKMGAKDQPYFRMHINNLPFPLKLFKQ